MIFSCERICIPKEKVAEDGHVLPRPTKKFLATKGTKAQKAQMKEIDHLCFLCLVVV
jgi:hypothetical protein